MRPDGLRKLLLLRYRVPQVADGNLFPVEPERCTHSVPRVVPTDRLVGKGTSHASVGAAAFILKHTAGVLARSSQALGSCARNGSRPDSRKRGMRRRSLWSGRGDIVARHGSRSTSFKMLFNSTWTKFDFSATEARGRILVQL